jgi:carbamoyl-phosphate synthase large subunit
MKKNILVTGSGGIGAGILHALLRCDPAVRARWNVVAADANPFSWGLYQTRQRVVLPLANSPQYIQTVRQLVTTYRLDAVVPGTELEMAVLLEHRDQLQGAVVVANREQLLPLMLDKLAAAQRLQQLGLPYIETLPARQWQQVAAKYGFPLIVKPGQSTGGSKGVQLVADEAEMEQLLPHLDDRSVPCVQPYVGSSDQEYTVGVLTHNDGTLIDSIVMKRKLTGLSLRTSRTIGRRICAVSTGCSQGFVVRQPSVQQFCEELALKLGSIGPLNVQLRRDVQRDEIYPFEIHTRFSGTTPIRADVGFNEVDILLRNMLLGERFGRLPYRTNVAVIRAFEHAIVPIDELLSADPETSP